MNILFLCGGLEPGMDGVGDYSRRLAGEVKRQGHHSTIIAINDGNVHHIIEQHQCDQRESVKVLRLPKVVTWKKRFSTIDNWIKAEKPDWISLQFVPFAFQKKGLPHSLAYRLKRVSGNIKLHIMFHELWVGEENLKFWILATLQKQLISSLLKRLNACVVHTHLPLYYDDLSSLAIATDKLPLFSNFSAYGSTVDKSCKTFRVGFFNQVANDDKIVDFLFLLYQESMKMHLEFEIVLIGGATSSIKSFGDKLESIAEFRNKVIYTGFLSHEDVSPVLSKCTIGMTSLSYSTLGKSGTSAAFLANGIPIAVPIYDERQSPFFDVGLVEALVTEPDMEKIYKATMAAKKWKQTLSLSRIAETFLHDLNNNYKHD
jgi:hypothetical protein